MNKIFIALGIVLVILVQLGFELSTKAKPTSELQVTIKEYKDTCIKKTMVESVYYNCKDLKNYLTKRGYNE